jgi:hypothetical protein
MSPKGQPSFTFGIFANSSGSQMEILERVKWDLRNTKSCIIQDLSNLVMNRKHQSPG